MTLNETWESYLKSNGADFVYFVDLSPLPGDIRGEYPRAVFFGKVLSREYLRALRAGQKPERREFGNAEHKMDALSVKLAEMLTDEGYKSAVKPENARLPHKTVGRLAGFGFIGKNTMLVSEDYGCAAALGKVITTAPFDVTYSQPKETRCGDCTACADICPANALLGKQWSAATPRDEMLVRKLCKPCMKCMVNCPYTVRYMEDGV